MSNELAQYMSRMLDAELRRQGFWTERSHELDGGHTEASVIRSRVSNGFTADAEIRLTLGSLRGDHSVLLIRLFGDAGWTVAFAHQTEHLPSGQRFDALVTALTNCDITVTQAFMRRANGRGIAGDPEISLPAQET